jgi:nodulation protein E
MSADAAHVTDPSVEGAAAAMRSALNDGHVPCDAVGYINAHGTGTPANDVAEARAIHVVFGGHARRLAVSSTKSMHGHVLGGTGGLEAVATVLSLHHGVLAPTANFTAPDPQCDLDVIPNTSRAADVQYALSNGFAFGGLNATLAFRRAER